MRRAAERILQPLLLLIALACWWIAGAGPVQAMEPGR